MLEKSYFKILQAVHHAEIINQVYLSERFPRGMWRQVQKLSGFIKPSSPNDTTRTKIQENTRHWMMVNMKILKEHYDEVIAEYIQDLPSFNETAFAKAVSFGRSRYKQKLTTPSVETLRNLVTAKPFQQTESVALATACLTPVDRDLGWPTLGSPEGRVEDVLSSPGELLIPPRKPFVVSTPQIDTSCLASKSKPVPTPRLNRSNPNPSPLPNLNLFPIPSPNPNLPSPRSYPPIHNPNPSLSFSGLGGRFLETEVQIHQTKRDQSIVLNREQPENLESVESVVSEIVSTGNCEVEVGTSDVQQNSVRKSHLSNVAIGSQEVTIESLMDREQLNLDDNSREENVLNDMSTLSNSGDICISPRRPVCHQSTNYKERDWKITITEPRVIIGDSNLSRIESHTYPMTQIDSFPGAHIHHLRFLLKQLQPCPKVERVILSVGLNNCLKGNLLATLKKQYQLLMHQARRVFPKAQIYIPLIQCSRLLSEDIKEIISESNSFLSSSYQILNRIPEDSFSVNDRDLIHWTPETALLILHSWMNELK